MFGKITVGRGLTINGKHERSTNLWCIEPKSIASFARGDYRCTIDKASGTNTLRLAYFRLGNAGMFWDKVGKYLELKKDSFVKRVSQASNPGKIFESQICVLPESFHQNDPVPLFDASGIFSQDAMSSIHGHENSIAGDGISNTRQDDSGNESLVAATSLGIASMRGDTKATLEYSINKLHGIANYSVDSPSPELPDLGNVSPLSLSPVPSLGIERLSPLQSSYVTDRNSSSRH